MFYTSLKHGYIEDIKISEVLNNKTIFELNYIESLNKQRNYKFLFIHGRIWYKIDFNNEIIKKCINNEASFLINGKYETDDKYIKSVKLLLRICKNEEVKKEIIRNFNNNYKR